MEGDLVQRRRAAAEMERVFTEIYRSNAWGSEESVSGPGSTEQRGASFRDDLLAVLRDLGTRTLLDAPCGDFNWIGPVADALDQYIGVDVVPEIIAANLRRHTGPNRRFLRLDLIRDRLPPADVVLCRDGLVHFASADIWRALANLRRTGARHLITTTFLGDRQNEEIATGSWRPLNLERPPFSFPPPERLIDERCWHTGGIYADKRLGVWRMRDVPALRLARAGNSRTSDFDGRFCDGTASTQVRAQVGCCWTWLQEVVKIKIQRYAIQKRRPLIPRWPQHKRGGIQWTTSSQ